jgi:hypothetical protein
MRFRLALLLLTIAASVSTVAQTINVYPVTPIAPVGTYQSVTAVVVGYNDKTVTWTTDGGTIVGTNPCVVNEPCTAAIHATTAGTYRLTATSNANHSLVATSTITITGSPTQTTGPPRFLVNAVMLPALQAKAIASNPLYLQTRTGAINDYNAMTAQGWNWSAKGGNGSAPAGTGAAWFIQTVYDFALMNLLDPSDPTYNWGSYGRDALVFYMQQITSGAYTPGGNEWSDDSQDLTVCVDWLQYG